MLHGQNRKPRDTHVCDSPPPSLQSYFASIRAQAEAAAGKKKKKKKKGEEEAPAASPKKRKARRKAVADLRDPRTDRYSRSVAKVCLHSSSMDGVRTALHI